jgi:ABC-type nitrate/sulfonate/bicarbonate transport system substrate-binding protein
VLTTSAQTLEGDPALVADVVSALEQGYGAVIEDPEGALDALLGAVPELDPAAQRDQLDALLAADAFSPPVNLSAPALERWAAWDLEHGILSGPLDVDAAFALD